MRMLRAIYAALLAFTLLAAPSHAETAQDFISLGSVQPLTGDEILKCLQPGNYQGQIRPCKASDIGAYTTTLTANNHGLNIDPVNMPAMRKCLAQIDTGTATAPCLVLCIGTSLTFGYQDNVNDLSSANWCAEAAKMLDGLPNGNGGTLRVDYDGVAGDGQSEWRDQFYTSQITSYGAKWTRAGGSGTQIYIGGSAFWQHADGGAGGNFTFHPFKQTDHCSLLALTDTLGLGRIQARLGAGTAAVLDTNFGTANVTALTASATLGANDLVITGLDATAKDIFIFTVNCWDSTHLGISFMNAGAYGTTSTQWAATSNPPWDANDVIHNASNAASLNPAVCMIELGTNDFGVGISTTTYMANIRTIAAACQAGGGDVIFVTPSHSNGCPDFCDAAFGPYVIAAKQVAATTPQGSGSAPVIDIYACLVNYQYESTAGWLAADLIHLSNTGYAAWARCAVPSIKAMFGL